MNAPSEPQGSSPLHSWLRRLRAYIISLQLQPGLGYRLKRGPTGTTLEIDARGGGSGSTPQRLRVDSVAGDYIVAHTWDGSTEGTESVYVAKAYKLRHSITSAVIDGTTVTYSYATAASLLDMVRTASSTLGTEAQRVTPRWLTDDEIFAFSASTGVDYTKVTGTVTETLTASMIDLNLDARAWAVE